MKMRYIVFVILLLSSATIVTKLNFYLEHRPVAVKLGYSPGAGILKLISCDQRYILAEWNVLKVIFYYGSLIENLKNNILIQPEYYEMFKNIETSVELDPYNMDAYYFAQAAFTWDVGHAQDVNRLLDYGMRFRTWDYYLPYFAGFNSAYFLKKPKEAAAYFKKAAEITENSLFTTLAARYLYDSDQTEVAILFLNSMIEKSTDKSEKEIYIRRLKALQSIYEISEAVSKFEKINNRKPTGLQELITTNILLEIPADPYGGSFYLDENGRVRTTSQLVLVNTAQNTAPKK